VAPAVPYEGLVLPHDAIASPGRRRLVAVEIRLDKYDAKSGLPPRETIERVASAAAAQGAERLILNGRACYDGRLDRDALTSKCIALNQAGRLCMSKRLGLRYRNGRGEFGGNALEMEEMMLRTNPELVGVALDAAEVRRAGSDVVNFFARHQNRIDVVVVREWETVPYAPLAQEIVKRRWQGWLVQTPANADSRRAIAKLFGV
jgi:sugar phosphate isomerase/epimerase